MSVRRARRAALAAQKSLENLFGGISLFADRLVRVRDPFRYGDQVGTVEEIGLRSTRVRTLDRTVVAIPNAEFSNLQLENYAWREEGELPFPGFSDSFREEGENTLSWPPPGSPGARNE